jgi:transposase
MRPPLWHPPVELSPAEHAIIKRIRRAKLFVCLRQYRHVLFADAFQQELLTLYKDQPQGHPPVPPAPLALATLLQAYTQVSDDEVIEATTMDRRWQLVLDCLDCETPPFSKGTLVVLRQRLIAQQMDRRLLERTVEIAATSGACGPRQVRAALDSSPLWGAGRVEDPSNLLGHALRKALGAIACDTRSSTFCIPPRLIGMCSTDWQKSCIRRREVPCTPANSPISAVKRGP